VEPLAAECIHGSEAVLVVEDEQDVRHFATDGPGANATLSKPTSADQLLSTVRDALARQSGKSRIAPVGTDQPQAAQPQAAQGA